MKREIEKRFEYVIKVNGKEVGHGLNPTGKYWEIKKQNPDKEVAIAWRTKEKVWCVEREIEFPYKEEEESDAFELVNTHVAIADSDDVPSIFGRVKGLDLFDAKFLKGHKVKLAWE